jgi:hypothetical protein
VPKIRSQRISFFHASGQLVLFDFPFSKWGLDFIGPINPPSLVGQVFILTTTYYFTKWTKFVPLKHSQDEQVTFFLETNIFSRFGIPLEIIIENSTAIISTKMNQFLAKMGVKNLPHHLITLKEIGKPSLLTKI